MKLSVVYVTCRPPLSIGNWISAAHNLVWVPEPEQNHYSLLAASLSVQTFTDYELIVVDESNELPRPELAGLGDRVRYVRPRVTPWRALGAFAASVARNTGLLAATGDVIAGLDDCVSFRPDLLAQVATRAERGVYPVLAIHPSDRPPNPPPFDVPQSRAGGLLAYPRDVALQVGGWETRFTGCKALEDHEFSERLVRNGVRLVFNPEVEVVLHGHARAGHQIQRCCHAVRALVAGQARANAPWNAEQLQAFGDRCPFQSGLERRASLEFPLCAITSNGRCDHPERPSSSARTIMHTYESAPFAPW